MVYFRGEGVCAVDVVVGVNVGCAASWTVDRGGGDLLVLYCADGEGNGRGREGPKRTL